jgi:osmoprotectant transport system substrate-binding protein
MGKKSWTAVATSLVLAVALFTGGKYIHARENHLVVGGKNFTEQYLLAEMAGILLERNGFSVELKTGVGSVVARKSLLNGQIDLYYEYTGTAYTVFYKKSDRAVMTDRRAVYQWVKEADAERGLIWLDPVQFNNTYTLMMREEHARKLGIQRIGDLASYVQDHPDQLTLGVNAEFWERPDGLKPLMEHYGFQVPFDRIKRMESGLVYKALREGNVDVSMGFATDGRIRAFGFTTLKDDKSFFPDYSPAPVVGSEVLEAHGQISEILRPIAEHLTTEEMRRLNAAVDVEHKDVHSVARSWLQEKGLL